MVSGLLSLLFVAVLQVGVALHVRNTLTFCAADRYRSNSVGEIFSTPAMLSKP